ncbi:MAG: hypothetical protein JNJ88_06440 [Planctomycetes bacterium]|nr:hypothetical protein [Planctomycetota bacterium]
MSSIQTIAKAEWSSAGARKPNRVLAIGLLVATHAGLTSSVEASSQQLWELRIPSGAGPSMCAQPSIPYVLQSIRRVGGLTWEEIADLSGVSRRAVHSWAAGESIAPENEQKVRGIHAAILFVNRGFGGATRAALLRKHADGKSAYKFLRAARFEDAKALLGRGRGLVSQSVPFSANAQLSRRPVLRPWELLDAVPEPQTIDRRLRRAAKRKTKNRNE